MLRRRPDARISSQELNRVLHGAWQDISSGGFIELDLSSLPRFSTLPRESTNGDFPGHARQRSDMSQASLELSGSNSLPSILHSN